MKSQLLCSRFMPSYVESPKVDMMIMIVIIISSFYHCCHFHCQLQYTPYKRSPYTGRILLSDVLGRRRPVEFVRDSYPIRGATL
jgi:hypothetical protein